MTMNYILEDNTAEDNFNFLKLTPEQVRVFEWLFEKGFLYAGDYTLTKCDANSFEEI